MIAARSDMLLRMSKVVRKERLPLWAAIAIMIPVTCVLSIASGTVAWVSILVSADILFALGANVPEAVLIALGCVVLVVGAWFPAKFIYREIRWREAEVEDAFCSNCDYNLSGNVSGICPECGEPIAGRRDDTNATSAP